MREQQAKRVLLTDNFTEGEKEKNSWEKFAISLADVCFVIWWDIYDIESIILKVWYSRWLWAQCKSSCRLSRRILYYFSLLFIHNYKARVTLRLDDLVGNRDNLSVLYDQELACEYLVVVIIIVLTWARYRIIHTAYILFDNVCGGDYGDCQRRASGTFWHV